MSEDLLWHEGSFGSAYLLNKGAVHKMSGASLAALQASDVEPGWLVYCNATGSIFIENNLYQRNEDNTAWDIVGLKSHSHTDASTGGGLSQVGIANMPATLELNKRFAKANEFWQTVVTTGTITDDATNGRVLIQSGTTSGGSATISDGGARKLNFAVPWAFEATLQVSSSTNFQVKLGVAAEDINGGNLTPPKAGIEGCSTSGVNWLLFSSNGSVRSTLATSAPVATGTPNIYRLECDPGSEIRLYKDGTLVATKTTNVPATGTTGFNDVYRAGIKNSAAENKILYHYGVLVVGGV